MVLIVVLVVIALLSLAALTFAELMLAERQAADLAVRQAQARAAAESGIEMARLFLAQAPQAQLEAGLRLIYSADWGLRDARPSDRLVMEKLILGLAG